VYHYQVTLDLVAKLEALLTGDAEADLELGEPDQFVSSLDQERYSARLGDLTRLDFRRERSCTVSVYLAGVVTGGERVTKDPLGGDAQH
jgi:hypothetical protein